MSKEYLPFYNSLSQKDKDFWLKCSKETLIDHFISNVRNGEVLLDRIEKAIEYNNQIIKDTKDFYRPTADIIYSGDCLIDIAENNINILKGNDEK